MNAKVFMAVRILLGLFVLVFGLNKFFQFLPAFELTGDPLEYFTALSKSQHLTMVGVVETLAGLALIFNKWGALMAVVLMSISVCAVLFHATLDPPNIGPALALLVLNVLALVGYKDRYAEILKA
ncbi:MAG: DoxX family membrane protein [Flavobacteriaceae bacterium]|uniref:DoxX family membrane protein n=1 Tax=Flagellimonas algarum TaxID=3230298 RepID=UPI003399F569|nr:DoxX family membrane protein [Flavobacteriaceae bacterium]